MTDSNPGNAQPPPSAKAQGKRPAKGTSAKSSPAPKHESVTPAPPSATPNAPEKPGVQTRQKRVLPSRSRRGGPGVGSTDVDMMILETRKRRLESEPLIPAETRLLLTTNSSLVPPLAGDPSGSAHINEQAYSRYFERPEVQKACREQQLIQVPEFSLLPEDTVASRFRPRASEEETADTSDAAYEKRHRKYETFEKRQRLREKEKLKHEQYKLNERIEQLRAMDTSAFLALPSSSFSEPPGVVHDGAGAGDTNTQDEPGTSAGLDSLPGAHVNGAAAYNEAERRRQEMLEVAESLAERYRVLLPPDRKWAEKKEAERREKMRASASESVEPDQRSERRTTAQPSTRASSDGEEEEEEEVDQLESEEEPPHRAKTKPTRGRPRRAVAVHAHAPAPAPTPAPAVVAYDSDGESEVDPEERERERSRGLKLRIKFPPGLVIKTHESATPEPGTRRKYGKHRDGTSTASMGSTSPSHTRISRGGGRAAGGHGHGHAKRQTALDEFAFYPPAAKKYKVTAESASASPARLMVTKTHPHHGPVPKGECLLLKAAERNAVAPSARKTNRHLAAFGVPVPDEIARVKDYEIPPWCWPRGEDDEESEIETSWYNGYGHGPPYDAFDHRWADDEEEEDIKEDVPDIATLDDD